MEKYWQDMMDSTSRDTGRWITYMTPQRILRRKTTYQEEDYFYEKWKSLQKKKEKEIALAITQLYSALQYSKNTLVAPTTCERKCFRPLIKSYRTNASHSV